MYDNIHLCVKFGLSDGEKPKNSFQFALPSLFPSSNFSDVSTSHYRKRVILIYDRHSSFPMSHFILFSMIYHLKYNISMTGLKYYWFFIGVNPNYWFIIRANPNYWYASPNICPTCIWKFDGKVHIWFNLSHIIHC